MVNEVTWSLSIRSMIFNFSKNEEVWGADEGSELEGTGLYFEENFVGRGLFLNDDFVTVSASWFIKEEGVVVVRLGPGRVCNAVRTGAGTLLGAMIAAESVGTIDIVC